MSAIKKEINGILLALAIGIPSYFLASFTPSWLNSILIALLLGIVIGNLIKIPQTFQSGIGFTSGKLLELSILFLAFSINYTHIAALGASSFAIIGLMVFSMLLLTFYLSRKANCPGATGWLVGFGTTICGSSAIAALAPSVKKNEDDVAISMAVVNLYGSMGMIALPFILQSFQMNTTQLGLLIGGTLHSVGNVAGAGYGMGKEIGDAAITIKLARVALLSPALIFFNYLVNKDETNTWKDHFKLPWYLWSFIAITIISSFIQFPKSFLEMMENGGKILLTIAMAAIGLKVSFQKLFSSGKKGITFGLLLFAAQIILVSVLMLIL
ncbi:MAG: putative sulfate exporter family transporter [Bacteroidia bacterium]|nr:putative sulfate exporter family transporter [Bacteroidia bacterium]